MGRSAPKSLQKGWPRNLWLAGSPGSQLPGPHPAPVLPVSPHNRKGWGQHLLPVSCPSSGVFTGHTCPLASGVRGPQRPPGVEWTLLPPGHHSGPSQFQRLALCTPPVSWPCLALCPCQAAPATTGGRSPAGRPILSDLTFSILSGTVFSITPTTSLSLLPGCGQCPVRTALSLGHPCDGPGSVLGHEGIESVKSCTPRFQELRASPAAALPVSGGHW